MPDPSGSKPGRPPDPSDRGQRLLLWTGVALLPAAIVLRAVAFRLPDQVELLYSQGLYPRVARILGAVNGWLPMSLAEVLLACLALAALLVARHRWRDRARRASRGWRGLAWRLGRLGWIAAGVGLLTFLLSWGFNYARPPLASRMRLDLAAIGADEVLALAGVAVEVANAGHQEAGSDPDDPTRLPLTLRQLDAEIDRRFRALELPGDRIRRPTSPAKPLLSSRVWAYLGISGIYIPFTGEPSFNALVPDVSMPITVAHEKAHQLGITDEGEANLAAVLACATSEVAYLRYAASLYMASVLVGGAARYAPEEAAAVFSELGRGPRRDLRAVREFWDRHRGPATRLAGRVNDAYLRSNRVPDGAQSYGRVVRLLVGVRRRGGLLPGD